MKILVVKSHENAILPKYATDGAACFDLFTHVPVIVPANGQVIVNTGLKMELPVGYGLYVVGRSGHGFKHGVRLANVVGVIDSDYRGDIMVCLHNDRSQPISISAGKAIAQGWIQQNETARFVLAEENKLTTTARGTGGFGSTDQN